MNRSRPHVVALPHVAAFRARVDALYTAFDAQKRTDLAEGLSPTHPSKATRDAERAWLDLYDEYEALVRREMDP